MVIDPRHTHTLSQREDQIFGGSYCNPILMIDAVSVRSRVCVCERVSVSVFVLLRIQDAGRVSEKVALVRERASIESERARERERERERERDVH